MLDTSTLSKDGGGTRISKTLTDELLPSYKILILGDVGIGKTSLIRRYISNEFIEDNESTIGLDYQTKKVQVAPGEKIILKLWDTAGSEKYSSIARNYFTNCDGIILCFDNTNKTTFDDLNIWINYINNYVKILDDKEPIFEEKSDEEEEEDEEDNKNVIIKWIDDDKIKPIIVLTGTKSDIGEKQVNMEDIAKLKEYLKCEYFETSSKNGDGVDDLFFFLAKELFVKIINKNENDNKGKFKLENKRFNEDDEGEIYEGISRSKISCC